MNVTSPAIQDGEYYDVPSYRLFLSPYRVSKLKEGDSSIDQSKVIIKEAVKERADELVPKHITVDDIVATVSYFLNLCEGVGTVDDIEL